MHPVGSASQRSGPPHRLRNRLYRNKQRRLLSYISRVHTSISLALGGMHSVIATPFPLLLKMISSWSRFHILAAFTFLVGVFASSAQAQTATPTLTAITRNSSVILYWRNFVSFTIDYTPGAQKVTQIRLVLSLSGLNGSYELTASNPSPGVTLAESSTDTLSNGQWSVTRVIFVEEDGRTTTYNGDGTRTTVPTVAGVPVSHTVNFAMQSFTVQSAYFVTPSVMTSVTRTSPDILTRGAPIEFTLGISLGTYDLTELDVVVTTPTGLTRSIQLRGKPVAGSKLSIPTDTSWPDGNYAVERVTLSDTASRTLTYGRDQTVVASPPLTEVPTKHSLALAAVDFRIVSPSGVAPFFTGTISPLSLYPGATATFSAVVSGTAPITYQWLKDGAPLAGATTATLTINNLQDTHTGKYTVTASNSLGTITSTPATLTVLPATPVFLVQPESAIGDEGGYFTVDVEISAPTVSSLGWKANVNNRTINGSVVAYRLVTLSQTGATVRFGPLTAADVGPFQVVVTNSAGPTLSESRTLSVRTVVPTIVTQPTNQSAAAGSNTTFSVSGLALGFIRYQWKKDDVDLAGATNETLTINGLKPADAGRYTVTLSTISGSTTSQPATLTVTAQASPTITTQPASQTAVAGNTVTFTVVATGTGPLTYQWYRDSTSLTGATQASLSLPGLTLSDAGVYTVTVTNSAGTIRSSNASLTVSGTAPTVVISPGAQNVAAGSSVTFTAQATGSTPLSYQWYREATALAGETRATLTLNNVTAAQAGSYAVTVSNTLGNRSASATLGVFIANPARLINLSVLTSLAASEDFTLGFVIGGMPSPRGKPLLVRAVGPSLAAFGLTTAHNDPRLELFTGSTPIGENDNWGGNSSTSDQFSSVGAFGFVNAASKDAALYSPSVSAGNSSARISGVGSASGTVLAELYETTPASEVTSDTPRLINVSVLKTIGSGVTAGFVIGGTGTKTILVRAVGPTLASFGRTDAVADPRLTLTNTAGAKFGENDDWGSRDAAIMTAVGAFALTPGSKDAALVASNLAPGSYTVQVTAAGNGAGVALIEVYEVP